MDYTTFVKPVGVQYGQTRDTTVEPYHSQRLQEHRQFECDRHVRYYLPSVRRIFFWDERGSNHVIGSYLSGYAHSFGFHTSRMPEDTQPDEKQCRICLDGPEAEFELGRLIRPCLCKGSISVAFHFVCMARLTVKLIWPGSLCMSSASNDGETNRLLQKLSTHARNAITITTSRGLAHLVLQPIQVRAAHHIPIYHACR
jgi:hypothetical protein